MDGAPSEFWGRVPRSQWKGWEDSAGGKGGAEAERKQQGPLRGAAAGRRQEPVRKTPLSRSRAS